jgi:hypothetical protein
LSATPVTGWLTISMWSALGGKGANFLGRTQLARRKSNRWGAD